MSQYDVHVVLGVGQPVVQIGPLAVPTQSQSFPHDVIVPGISPSDCPLLGEGFRFLLTQLQRFISQTPNKSAGSVIRGPAKGIGRWAAPFQFFQPYLDRHGVFEPHPARRSSSDRF